MDQPDSQGNFDTREDLYRDKYELIPVSATTADGLDRFARRLFKPLDLVRAYTKAPGKRAELDAPYVMSRGATVLDAARHVHKDFAERLRFARLFHEHGKRAGMPVGRHHAVEDEDILEFHV
jgi:hypothetical protein